MRIFIIYYDLFIQINFKHFNILNINLKKVTLMNLY